MSATIPANRVAAPAVAAAPPTAAASTFEQRWNAWEARGAANDRATRRNMAIGAPIATAIAVAIIYLVAGR